MKCNGNNKIYLAREHQRVVEWFSYCMVIMVIPTPRNKEVMYI